MCIRDRKGNNINLTARISKQLRINKNIVFIGLGFKLLQTNSTTINGWTREISSTESILIPIIVAELGHRYNFLSKQDFDFYFQNAIELRYQQRVANTKHFNLIWKPGIRAEKSLSSSVRLSFELNYGLALFDLARSSHYQLKNNFFGADIGIMQRI